MLIIFLLQLNLFYCILRGYSMGNKVKCYLPASVLALFYKGKQKLSPCQLWRPIQCCIAIALLCQLLFSYWAFLPCQVGTLCVLFFVLFLGNCLTTAVIIPQKLKERFKLKYRFTRLDKYIWTHKRRRVSFRWGTGSHVCGDGFMKVTWLSYRLLWFGEHKRGEKMEDMMFVYWCYQ